MGHNEGITHHYIADGNSTAITHHLNPVLDVKKAQLHMRAYPLQTISDKFLVWCNYCTNVNDPGTGIYKAVSERSIHRISLVGTHRMPIEVRSKFRDIVKPGVRQGGTANPRSSVGWKIRVEYQYHTRSWITHMHG